MRLELLFRRQPCNGRTRTHHNYRRASEEMIRTTLTVAVLTFGSSSVPAMANSTKAYCTLAWHDDSMPLIEGPCDFSQSEGNAYVDDFNYYKFAFPSAEQGKTYKRDNKSERISFNREGEYTLNVLLKKPGPKIETKTTPSFPLKCQLNKIASTCRTEPNKAGGFALFFSHGDKPIFDITPVGPATTDHREMVDRKGTRWEMSGHHSFVLEEIGSFANTISISRPSSIPLERILDKSRP